MIRKPSVNRKLAVNRNWKTRTRAVEMAQTGKRLQCAHEDPSLDSSKHTLKAQNVRAHL